MRRTNNKRKLYESIMRDVAKTVKKHLNENESSSDIEERILNFFNNITNNNIIVFIDNSGSIYNIKNIFYTIMSNLSKYFNLIKCTFNGKKIATCNNILDIFDLRSKSGVAGTTIILDLYNFVTKNNITNTTIIVITDGEFALTDDEKFNYDFSSYDIKFILLNNNRNLILDAIDDLKQMNIPYYNCKGFQDFD